MNTIVWYNPEYKYSVETKDVKVNLRGNTFTIIYSAYESEYDKKFEGKLTFEKKLGVQNCEGKIYYFHSNGNSEIFDISCTGSFIDDAFDEFTGDWYEGDIYNIITISIEDIIDIQDEENSLNLEQAEILLENFKRINSALPVKDEETTDDNQESLEEITLDLEKAQQLIRDFEKLDKPLARKKTFLEIIGVNHLEAVSSKALAFFLDTEEAHGLKDMCIQALVELINQQKSLINSDLSIKTKYINREVSTVDKKRIDLVIDCHDSLIIIENKISHNPDNPFKSYIEYGDEKAQEKPVHYVLLGIQEPVERIEPFIFISHFKLVKAILSKLNEYIFNADQYYLTLLLDYLNSIELLNTESEIGKMEKAIANFFANNLEKIQEIYEAREHFIAFIEQKLLSTKEILSARNSNLLQNVETVDNYPYILGGYISSNNYKVKNHPINFDVNIVNYADGCWLTMDFFKCDIYRKPPSNCLDILKQIAIDIGLDYESDELNEKECLTIKAMDWNETPEEIANQILPILQKIEFYIIKEKQNI